MTFGNTCTTAQILIFHKSNHKCVIVGAWAHILALLALLALRMDRPAAIS
jgi:hypothetical protein